MSYDNAYYSKQKFAIFNQINKNHNNKKLESYFGAKQLTQGSLDKYASQLKVLHQLYFNDVPYTTNWREYAPIKSTLISSRPLVKSTFIKYKKELINEIDKMPKEKQRLFYNSLFNYTGDLKYQKLMQESNKANVAANKDKLSNKNVFDKNEKENANMITKVQRDTILDELEIEADLAYMAIKERERNTPINPRDFHIIQDYILFMLVSGKYIPIRRSQDWTNFKIDNVNVNNDNYYDKNDESPALIFNSYKTYKFNGQQRIPFKVYKYDKDTQEIGFYSSEGARLVKKELDKFIKLVEEYNNSEYLLQDTKGNQMSKVNMTHRLNKIFGGKKVSINMLRKSDYSMRGGHIIESKLNFDDEIKKLNFIMKAGGSSISNLQNYVRK
jgi:hypothetical protein